MREWGGTWDRTVVPWRPLWGGDPSLRSLGRIFHFTRLSDGFLDSSFSWPSNLPLMLGSRIFWNLPVCWAAWGLPPSSSMPRDRRVGPTPGVPGSLFLCAWRQVFSVHLSSSWWTFKKVKSKNHRKPIICSHWHSVIKVSYCPRIMLQEAFQPECSVTPHWHPSELLSAFANSLWQVSKAIWVHVKAVTGRLFKLA